MILALALLGCDDEVKGLPVLVVTENDAARRITVGDLEYDGVRLDRAADGCGYPPGTRVEATVTVSPGGFPWPVDQVQVTGPDDAELDATCVREALSRLPLDEPRAPGTRRELGVMWVVGTPPAPPATPGTPGTPGAPGTPAVDGLPEDPALPPLPPLPPVPPVPPLAPEPPDPPDAAPVLLEGDPVEPTVVVQVETVDGVPGEARMVTRVRRVEVLGVELTAPTGPRLTPPAPPAWVGGAGERAGLLDVAYDRGQLRFHAEGPRSAGALPDPGLVAGLLRCSDHDPALVRALLVFREGELDDVETWPATACVHTRAEVAEEALLAVELDGTRIDARPWALVEVEVPLGGAP